VFVSPCCTTVLSFCCIMRWERSLSRTLRRDKALSFPSQLKITSSIRRYPLSFVVELLSRASTSRQTKRENEEDRERTTVVASPTLVVVIPIHRLPRLLPAIRVLVPIVVALLLSFSSLLFLHILILQIEQSALLPASRARLV
jgi:hypothetical protein